MSGNPSKKKAYMASISPINPLQYRENCGDIAGISPQPYVWLAKVLFPSWYDPVKIYLAGLGFFPLRKLGEKKQNQFKSQDCGIWVLILSVGGPESERQERAISLDAAVSARSSFKSSSAVLSQQGLISVAWGDIGVRLIGGPFPASVHTPVLPPWLLWSTAWTTITTF